MGGCRLVIYFVSVIIYNNICKITQVFVITWTIISPCFGYKQNIDLFFFAENPMKYTRYPGKKIDVSFLAESVVDSVVQCAVGCHINTGCINFNFMKSSRRCQLVQGRTSDSHDTSDYDVYSEC